MTADEARKATKKGVKDYAESCVVSILQKVKGATGVGWFSVKLPPESFAHYGSPSDAVMDGVCKELRLKGYAVCTSYVCDGTKGETSSTLKYLMVSWK